MMKIISFNQACQTVIILNIMVILFHLAILSGFIPYENVWAGRIKSYEDMIVFESISILINLIFIGLVLLKKKSKIIRNPNKILQIGLWVFVIIFSLNTIGNLFAVSFWEKLIATPLTFILALLTLRIAVEKN
jgi:hypothetical protein